MVQEQKHVTRCNSSKTQYSIRCVFNTKLNDLEIVLSTEFCEFSPESRYGT